MAAHAFLGCQIAFYMSLEICEVRAFKHMRNTLESLSFDQRTKVVDELILIQDVKQSHRLELGVHPN